MTEPCIQRPDALYQALMEAQASLSDRDAERFRARLILLLAARVGDDRARPVFAAKSIGRATDLINVVSVTFRNTRRHGRVRHGPKKRRYYT